MLINHSQDKHDENINSTISSGFSREKKVHSTKNHLLRAKLTLTCFDQLDLIARARDKAIARGKAKGDLHHQHNHHHLLPPQTFTPVLCEPYTGWHFFQTRSVG